MTRSEFLTIHWRPYPQPPAALWGSSDWAFGKIAQKNGVHFQFLNTTESFEIRSQQVANPHLGPSVPTELILEGDVVAYQKSSGVVYLLSPNLLSSASSAQKKHPAAVQWQLFLETVRTYFINQGFKCWQTPNLLVSPGIDAHIDFFSVQGVRSQKSYFLPTSPEFALKKAIADGETKIFEIKPCFRDDDSSSTHVSEFSMLEWYRAYADKWTLFEDFLGLVRHVVEKMGLPLPLDFLPKQTSMAELFREKLNFNLTPQTTEEDLLMVLKHHQMHFSDTDDWDDLFFRLFIEFIEPHLGAQGPEAVFHFPISQGSLSKKTEDGWSDRFEIYWNGLELANAYQEQNDPQEVGARYSSEVAKRLRAQKQPHPRDPEFLLKMREGFPPCAGIALGLERLWMVLNKISTIQDLRS